MDLVRNPYVPGAGSRPPELAGRQAILDGADVLLRRAVIGRPTQSFILTGLRGVGKTVLLNEMERIAEEVGYLTCYVEAREKKPLPVLIVQPLRRILQKMSIAENAKEQTRRAMRVMKSFIGTVKLDIGGAEVSIDPERGAADSGDIESDVPDLLQAVGEAAAAAGRGVCILIDELQYLSEEEFGALIVALHRTTQKQLPLVLIGAGLPQIVGLAGNSKSYAERLFRFPAIGALEVDDAVRAILNPAREEGADFEQRAIADILSVTQRYPYFLQQWAYEAWSVAEGPTITSADVEHATPLAIAELDQSFFKVRLDRCTPAEKRYMRALAELGEGTHRSGDVARILEQKVTSAAPTRNNLIKKGMIYSPAHGDVAFTVPLFDAYMRRAMPPA